jgi:hypothetical protein
VWSDFVNRSIGVRLEVCIVILLISGQLSGCADFAETDVQGPSGQILTINHAYFNAHEGEFEGVGDSQRLLLERALADSGYQIIDRVIFSLEGGQEIDFVWDEAADQAWIFSDGSVAVSGEVYEATTIRAKEHSDLELVEASILDLAATASQALGLRPPEYSEGQALDVPHVDHVLLLFLDGFGYRRYEQALVDDLIPNLASLPDPLIAITTYPPITTASSASLLTGAPPDVHGVVHYGIRQTEIETLLDVASQSGLDVKAIEGAALAFRLRGAELQLSGDRNGNGMSDDEVLENMLEILESGAPDLFFVHFHGIDDAGHTYGPVTAEENEVVRFVDTAVGAILDAMPDNSLTLIFADHGMHSIDESGRAGNHRHLIPLDMLIPVFLVSK